MPVYRNADTLVELHDRLRAALRDERVELIFVNDACPAGSAAVLRKLAADPGTVVLTLERNVGQHRAVLVGLARARGAWTVVLDADLQDPPEAVPLLLARAAVGDVGAVFAGRRGTYESRLRLLTSRLFKRTLHALCGVPPDAGIFAAVSKRTVERVLAMRGPAPFVVAMIGCAGLPMTSIPVERAPRPNGSSAYSTRGRARSAWRAFVWVLAWRLGTTTRAGA